MGALEAKKFPLFSEWQMERCSECVAYHSELGAQLENPLSGREVARARANDRKVETLGKTTWKISSTAGDVQKELVTFLMTYNGNCAQAPLTLQACWGGRSATGCWKPENSLKLLQFWRLLGRFSAEKGNAPGIFCMPLLSDPCEGARTWET